MKAGTGRYIQSKMTVASSWSTCWDLISEMQLRSAAARDSADAPNAAEQSVPEETQHGLGKKKTTKKGRASI